MGDLHEENTETGVFFPRASKRPSDQLEVFRALRDLEQRAQIKRISPAENTSREIQESGINPDKTSLNSISSFGSRSEQISASRKPLFLDTTLCLKEPAQETMITQGQESCFHTPVWGVEGFNISTSKEVEEELTTGKQLTRVFNGPDHVDEHTDDIAMINTINFDALLLGEAVSHSTSTAPMNMIGEEVEILTIEQNTVPLPEDTTNIMEMIENASFDFTLPEPFPTTTLHITEQKTEVEVIPNNNTETVWAGASFDDANLGLCLPAVEAEGRIELPVNVANNNNNNNNRSNVESNETDDLLKWIMDDTQIANFAFPDEVEEATTNFLIQEVKVEDGGSKGGEGPEDEGAEQPGEPGLQGKEEEEVGGGGDRARHLAREEHPAAGCPQGHGEGGGFVQEKDTGAGFRSEKLKEPSA